MRILSLQISAIVFMVLAIMDCLGNTCKFYDPMEESVVDSISEDQSCNGKHDHHHHGSHDHHHDDLDYQHPWEANQVPHNLLQEELAEEEDLRLYARRYEDDNHEIHNSPHLSGLGLWMQAMGCSLLVSMASLVCVFILPFIFVQGKPSNAFVDSLAVFGAGAMLGDAFLHQLPHAFGTGNLHTHDNHMEHVAHHHHYVEKHSHSLGDLSVGLSILSGIMVFFMVENIVRYVEDVTGGRIFNGHHHHKLGHNLDDTLVPNELHDSCFGENKSDDKTLLQNQKEKYFNKKESDVSTNLVLGYLNLFSDGIHNFTDGVALGNAFMLYGSVGGWSRTLFLLAHELPQEVGDFGILVRSGFSVKKALVFNFMSALAAFSGTAMVLVWRGGDGAVYGKSSLIEGFTAGGFVYISIAGVLAGGVNNEGGGGKEKKCLWRICVELVVLMLGVGVALSISILE